MSYNVYNNNDKSSLASLRDVEIIADNGHFNPFIELNQSENRNYTVNILYHEGFHHCLVAAFAVALFFKIQPKMIIDTIESFKKIFTHHSIPYALGFGENIAAAGNDQKVTFYDTYGNVLQRFDYTG